ncbi:hypothetical protein [Clostridium perfringens]|nr:hypothetical protein [Clostridium perfringens]
MVIINEITIEYIKAMIKESLPYSLYIVEVYGMGALKGVQL